MVLTKDNNMRESPFENAHLSAFKELQRNQELLNETFVNCVLLPGLLSPDGNR